MQEDPLDIDETDDRTREYGLETLVRKTIAYLRARGVPDATIFSMSKEAFGAITEIIDNETPRTVPQIGELLVDERDLRLFLTANGFSEAEAAQVPFTLIGVNSRQLCDGDGKILALQALIAYAASLSAARYEAGRSDPDRARRLQKIIDSADKIFDAMERGEIKPGAKEEDKPN